MGYPLLLEVLQVFKGLGIQGLFHGVLTIAGGRGDSTSNRLGSKSHLQGRGQLGKPCDAASPKLWAWHPQPDSNRCYQDENLTS